MITTIDEIANLFPEGVVQRDSGQWSSPCPFCDPRTDPGDVIHHNGVRFVGENRLFWKIHENRPRMICRRCGVHYPDDIAALFGKDVGEGLKVTGTYQRPILPLGWLWDDREVQAATENIVQSYWEKFGWTKETLKKYRLGFGAVGRYENRHVIPMKLTRVTHETTQEKLGDVTEDWYLAGRVASSTPDTDLDKKVVHSKGSVKPYLWLDFEVDPESPIFVVTEGEKDAITAGQLGFNFTTSYGVHHWGDSEEGKDKFSFLKTIDGNRFETVYILGDNDESGEKFNHTLASQAAAMGFTSRFLEWPLHSPYGDITDYLADNGTEATREFILSHLSTPFVRKKGFRRPKAVTIETEDSEADTRVVVPVVPLEDIRGDGELSLSHQITSFLDDYVDLTGEHPKGVIKLLGVGPGAGKTHTLIQEVERRSKEYRELREEKLQEYQDELQHVVDLLEMAEEYAVRTELEKKYEKLKKKIDEFSLASVGWFAQYVDNWHNLELTGADMSRWFNYQPRNPDNCQHYEMQNRLGKNHHDIRQYCESVCPFRQQCKENGYLAQEREALQSDIVFFRHQHLMSEGLLKNFDLIVIDENPFHIMESGFIQIRPSDLNPFNAEWRDGADEEVQSIAFEVLTLVNSLRQLLVKYGDTIPQDDPDFLLTGNRIVEELRSITDKETNGAISLDEVLGNILETKADVFREDYHPNFKEVKGSVPMRCMPQLFKALVEEITDLRPADGYRPTRITLQNGALRVYATDPVKIKRKTPIIVADATANLPELYTAMFQGRYVDEYSPMIRSDLATTTVIQGSDFPRTYLQREAEQLVKALDSRDTETVQNIFGRIEDLFAHLKLSEEVSSLKQTVQIVQAIDVLARRHKSILVVTYKKVREVLERMVSTGMALGDVKHKISWGHYGALRGSNEYKDIESVLLIGVHRIPYDELFRRILMWGYYLGYTEPFTRELVHQEKLYHGVSDKGYQYVSFADTFPSAYVDAIEEGEIIQCAERIRPHVAGEPRSVYIMANRPSLTHVDRVTRLKDLLQNDQNDGTKKIRRYVEDYYRKRGILPTYSEIRSACKVGTKLIKTVMGPIRESVAQGTYLV